MTRVRSTSSRSAKEAAEHVRRTHLLVAVGVTAASALAYLGVLLIGRGQLPDTMATHFGLAGRADDFMRTSLALLVQGAAVVGVPLAIVVVLWAGQWWKGQSARQLTALIAGLSAGLTTLFVVITRLHFGIEDPTSVSIDLQTGVLSLGLGAVVAALAAVVLPPALPRPAEQSVEPLQIAPSDKVSWFGRATSSRSMLIVLAAAVAVLALSALASGIWWLWLVVLGLIVLILGVSRFDVTIDKSGFAWRSALGIPRGRLALDDIESASVIQVGPGDFGGFGVRPRPGRLGLITRSGRALNIEHRRGALVITVDDADMAASVVEGLKLRARR